MLVKGFLFFSSDAHFIQPSGTILAIFGIWSPKEHFCEMILKSSHWPKRRCNLKIFSFCSFGGHFVQRSETILAILVEGYTQGTFLRFF